MKSRLITTTAAATSLAIAGAMLAAPSGGSAQTYIARLASGATVADLDAGTLVSDLDALGMAVVSATPADVRALRADADVVSLTHDRSLAPTSHDDYSYSAGSASGSSATSGYSAGATVSGGGGDHGDGTTIAVIDTGISDHPDFGDRIIGRIDLSGEGDHVDGYGHGTAMAGIAAGDGTLSNGAYVGVAPAARLVAVKVAGADGNTSMSKLMEGLAAVAESRDAFGTDVALIAYATPEDVPAEDDPFAYAVQRLHELDIVPVVSAGNNGGDVHGIAAAPAALTVGGYDLADGAVSGFSAAGLTIDGISKPDLVAPAERIVSPIPASSFLAKSYPNARVGKGYLRGSGTSQAAAIVAGTVAVLEQRFGRDDSRDLHTRALRISTDVAGNRDGAGLISLDNVRRERVEPFTPEIILDTASALGGEDVSYTQDSSSWSGYSWSSDQWSGYNWSGYNWSGYNWSGYNWSGYNWSGYNWSGYNWSADGWASDRWE